MGDIKVGGDQRALCSLPGARRRNHQHAHDRQGTSEIVLAHQSTGTMFSRVVVLTAR
jgi:hypothetical protein